MSCAPRRAADAAAIAATIAAAFEQYRGKLEPESGAFRETADGIAAELARECGAILAERNGRILGCVMVQLMDDDLYFGRLAVVPEARGQGIARRLIEAVEDEARRRELGRRPAGRAHRADREPGAVHLARLRRDFARGA